jgi:tetratricopeptide (TPR) repeat protein
MHAWVLEKTTPLGQILLRQGALHPDAHALLEPLVHKHLQMHGNDPERSLAALSAIGGAIIAGSLFWVDLFRPTSEAAKAEHRQLGGANLPPPRPAPLPDRSSPTSKALEDIMQESLLVQEKMLRQNPTLDACVGLGTSYASLGKIVYDRSKPQEALDWYGKALNTLQAALRTEPGHTNAREALRDSYKGRAEVLVRLGRHRDSLADWDRALQLDTWPIHHELRLQRALAFARAGDHTKATEEAGALAQGENLPGEALYSLARVFALAATVLKTGQPEGPRLPDADRERLGVQYAARAMELLSKARDSGFLKQAANLSHFNLYFPLTS